MATNNRSFAIVTGASTGIGLELAKECARHGFDLLIAADEPEIHKAAKTLRTLGGKVEAGEADLSTEEGVGRLYEAARGRQIDALLANAGRSAASRFHRPRSGPSGSLAPGLSPQSSASRESTDRWNTPTTTAVTTMTTNTIMAIIIRAIVMSIQSRTRKSITTCTGHSMTSTV